MTYYAIPYKPDESCCFACGEPETPCECSECKCDDVSDAHFGLTVTTGGWRDECIPILFKGDITFADNVVNVTWTPPCCIGDPPRQETSLAIQIDGIGRDFCVGPDPCYEMYTINGDIYELNTPYYFGPTLDSNSPGLVSLDFSLRLFCYNGHYYVFCNECTFTINVTVEPCAPASKWYGVMASTCSSGDCTTGRADPTELSLSLTPAEVAAIPTCIGGSQIGVGSIQIQSLLGGPYDNSLDCSATCPPWYCVMEQDFENTDCTGLITATRYYCAQLRASEVASYPFCYYAETYSTRFSIISGPYTHEHLCEAVCEVCCDPATAYYRPGGIPMVLTGTGDFLSFGPNGVGSEVNINFGAFGGLTHAGDGLFTGTVSRRVRQYAGSVVPSACHVKGTIMTDVTDNPTYSIRYLCSTTPELHYYWLSTSEAAYTASLSPNCGSPVGCSGGQIIVCSSSYASSCYSLSYHHIHCNTFNYGDPANCLPAGVDPLTAWFDNKVSFSIA